MKASADATQRGVGRRRSESGDTLIEILIAMGILGIVGGAILYALISSITTSASYRGLATLDTVTRSAAADITSVINDNQSTVFTCGSAPTVYSGAALAGFALPAGLPTPAPSWYTSSDKLPANYTASVASFGWWDGSQVSSTCSSTESLVLSIIVKSPQGATDKTTVVVANPSGPANYCDSHACNATQLVWVYAPSGSQVAGSNFTVAPAVAVEDPSGHIVTTDLSSMSLTLNAPAGYAGTLSNSCSGNEFEGVVTFSGCSLNLVGSGFTLQATDGSLPSSSSGSFSVVAGAPAQLSFVNQPGGGSAATSWSASAQPIVQIQDANGNLVTSDTSAVTLSLTATVAAGTTFSCAGNTTTQAAIGGTATFAGCSINTVGSYSLTATDTDNGTVLASEVSNSFSITVGAATQVVFVTQPVGATGGKPFQAQPVVWIEDAGGNLVTTDSSNVTLALTSNLSGNGATASLACTADPVSASSGVATFSSCAVDLFGSYALTATDGSLASAVSSTFTITTGAPYQLAFSTQPSVSDTAGTAFATQPVVEVQDAGGNIVTSDTSNVTVSMSSNSSGASLACSNNTVAAVAGVATFSGCKTTTAGAFTLTAADTDGSVVLVSATSSQITVAALAPSQLNFVTQLSNATGGSALSPQPVVNIEDAFGNVVPSDTGVSVTLAIGTNPSGGVLTCTGGLSKTTAGAGSAATFSGCAINAKGSGYTLTATAAGLAPDTSNAFNITVGTATQVVFATQPAGAVVNGAFQTQPVVSIEDAGGNVAATSTSSITLAIGTNGGGGTLSCATNPLTTSAGVATFSNCYLTKAGSYTLKASATGLTAVTSSSFTVSSSTATKLAFGVTSRSSLAGEAFPSASQPVVKVENSSGVVVNTDSSSVVLSISTGVSGGVLSGCTQTETSGQISFAGCSLSKAGSYTLKATDGALTTAISGTYTVATSTASKLVFQTPPTGSNASGLLTPSPIQVAVQNASGTTVTTDSSQLTLSITSGTGTLTGCSATETSGVFNITGCTIATSDTYTITASDGTLTQATTASFPVTN